MLSQDPPNLVEVQIREEIRAELLEDAAKSAASLQDRDRRMTALVISATLVVCLILPMLAAVVGASWRVFKWAAGI